MNPFRLVALLILAGSFATAQTAPLNLVYLGDSITAGVTLPDPATQSPCNICTQTIQEAFPSRIVSMSNRGRGGCTTVDFLPETKFDFPAVEAAARQLQAAHPGVLVFSILLGTNDSAVKGPNGSPVSPAQYRINMGKIVDQLLGDFPGAKVVLHHPIWYSPNTHNGAVYDQPGLARLTSYVPQIDSLVQAESRRHPGRVFVGDTESFAYFRRHYEKELTPQQGAEGTFYLHPNVAGAVALGNFWAQAMLSGEVLN